MHPSSTSTMLLFLFGGDRPWNPSEWIASDDRVRGGISQSNLELSSTDPSIARFYGTLDITTLGGAGFASRRASNGTNETLGSWDLSNYDGIELDIASADNKKYTFTLADTLLPPEPNTGREQATVVYEYDFQLHSSNTSSSNSTSPSGTTTAAKAAITTKAETAGSGGIKIFVPWGAFTATYRGRVKEDAPPLDRAGIKRMSLLIRSFFGEQQGSFELFIRSIAARKSDSNVKDDDDEDGKRDGDKGGCNIQ